MKRQFSAFVRLTASLSVLAGVALLLPRHLPLGARLMIAWNAAVFTFLGIVAVSITGVSASGVRAHAQRIGGGRLRMLAGVLVVCLASLVAVILVLYGVKREEAGFRLQVLLSVASVFTAWLLLQVMFALFYARYYYQPKNGKNTVAGGLRFAGDDPPDYWDFIYFSCVIGTSFATSDTNIESQDLRRAVLVHSLLSFLFSTVLIGLVMNAIAALF